MEYVIRPVRKEDAESINTMHRMPGVFENTLAIPSRRIARSEKDIESLGADSHVFVAVKSAPHGEGEIIGWAGLFVGPDRLRHCAEFGIMVRVDCQGMGVGHALIDACLDLADSWLGLVRVELIAYADNTRAISLYERYGFVREGVRRMGSLRFGEFADEVMMARLRPR